METGRVESPAVADVPSRFHTLDVRFGEAVLLCHLPEPSLSDECPTTVALVRGVAAPLAAATEEPGVTADAASASASAVAADSSGGPTPASTCAPAISS